METWTTRLACFCIMPFYHGASCIYVELAQSYISRMMFIGPQNALWITASTGYFSSGGVRTSDGMVSQFLPVSARYKASGEYPSSNSSRGERE